MRIIQHVVRPPVLGNEFPDLSDFYEQLNKDEQNLVGILRGMGIDVEPEDEPIIPKSDNHTAPSSLVRADSKNKDFHQLKVITPITRISIDNFLLSFVDQAYQDGLLPDYLYYLCHLVWEAENFLTVDYLDWQGRLGPKRRTNAGSDKTDVIAQFLTTYQMYPRLNELIARFVNQLEYLFPARKLLSCHYDSDRFDIFIIGPPLDYQAAITRLTTGTSFTVAQHAAYSPLNLLEGFQEKFYVVLDETGEFFYDWGNLLWQKKKTAVTDFQDEVIRLYRLRKLRLLLPE